MNKGIKILKDALERSSISVCLNLTGIEFSELLNDINSEESQLRSCNTSEVTESQKRVVFEVFGSPNPGERYSGIFYAPGDINHSMINPTTGKIYFEYRISKRADDMSFDYTVLIRSNKKIEDFISIKEVTETCYVRAEYTGIIVTETLLPDFVTLKYLERV